MDRFNEAFHQSDIRSYLKCPRSFYYDRVLKLDREKTSLAGLAGRAGHRAVELAHEDNAWDAENSAWDAGRLYAVFFEAFKAEQEAALNRGTELHGSVDLNKYRVMLAEYAAKPYNREAEVLILEREFYFEIKPAKTTYPFSGRLDQLMRIPTSLLLDDFPELFKGRQIPKTVLLHRDLKFGRRKEVSRFELALNAQVDVYAYALKRGVFYDESGQEYFPDMIPDFHVVYYLQDHVPYENDSGQYKKDEDGNHVPCDLVSEPCLVGKKQQPCKGLRSYCTKQKRGPGMYFTTRPAARIEAIPRELMNACASMRMGHYPRQLGELCFSYCQFRSVCEAEVLADLEAA